MTISVFVFNHRFNSLRSISKGLLICTLIFAILPGCRSPIPSRYVYQTLKLLNDQIPVGSLSEVGLETNLIAKGIEKIEKGRFGEIHSFKMFKDGKLVVEEYFPGLEYKWDGPDHYGEWKDWNQSMQHMVQSVSKSVTSICVGIAIDYGYIKSVKDPIFDYLPDYNQYNQGGREVISIEHLLTMTSGLQWSEWNAPLGSMENDQIAIWFDKEGPINYTLRKPVIYAPGSHFIYSGGNMELLGEIIKETTYMTIDSFSKKYLFEPLGISDCDWWLTYPSGEVHAASGLKTTPRAMIKIGLLFLQNGKWKGRQILSTNWIA